MTTKEFNNALHNLSDEKIFKKFYDEICPQIFKISLSIFHSNDICQDIAQDVFKNILTSQNLSFVEYPRAWLFTLCKNIGLKYIHNKEVTLEDYASYTSFLEKYDCGEVNDILKELSREERYIIEAHHLIGFSLKEIAQILNRPYDAVAKQHRRILKKLEKKLSKKF